MTIGVTWHTYRRGDHGRTACGLSVRHNGRQIRALGFGNTVTCRRCIRYEQTHSPRPWLVHYGTTTFAVVAGSATDAFTLFDQKMRARWLGITRRDCRIREATDADRRYYSDLAERRGCKLAGRRILKVLAA